MPGSDRAAHKIPSMPVKLLNSSGDPKVDRLLSGAIGLYVSAFPGRMRAAYLFGSYADGSVVPGSDVDLDLFFENPLNEAELKRFWEIARDILLLTPVRLDSRPLGMKHLKNGAPPTLRDGRIIYGVDVVAKSGLEPIVVSRRRDVLAAFMRIQALRGNPPYVVAPVDYPDRSLPYFGYVRARDPLPLQLLVDVITTIARASLSAFANKQIGSRQRAVDAYPDLIRDDFGTLVRDVYQLGKLKWLYHEPSEGAERQRLHELCEQLPEFENHFLSHCRSLFLTDLAGSNPTAIAQALITVRHIIYPDETFVGAIKRLAESPDTKYAYLVKEVLQTIETERLRNVEPVNKCASVSERARNLAE